LIWLKIHIKFIYILFIILLKFDFCLISFIWCDFFKVYQWCLCILNYMLYLFLVILLINSNCLSYKLLLCLLLHGIIDFYFRHQHQNLLIILLILTKTNFFIRLKLLHWFHQFIELLFQYIISIRMIYIFNKYI